jgi:hypothetical protein
MTDGSLSNIRLDLLTGSAPSSEEENSNSQMEDLAGILQSFKKKKKDIGGYGSQSIYINRFWKLYWDITYVPEQLL